MSDAFAPLACPNCEANAKSGNNYCGGCGRYVSDPTYSLSPVGRYLLSRALLRTSPIGRYVTSRGRRSCGDADLNSQLQRLGLHSNPDYVVAGVDAQKCARCQKVNLPSDHYCVNCGAPLTNQGDDPLSPTLPW